MGPNAQNPTFFGIVPFKHTHTRYPKTMVVAYLVPRYARLGRHTKTAHFGALCISDRQILSIQKHCWLHIWYRGMCVWGATPKPHIFWHCAFQKNPYWVSENTVAGIFGAEVCVHGATRQTTTFFGIVHFKHPNSRHPKTLLLAYLV